MILNAMLEDEFTTFVASRPLANQAKEDIIGDMITIFAFAHVVMKLSESLRYFDEDHVRVDQLWTLYLDLRLFLDNNFDKFTAICLFMFIKGEF